MTKKMIKETVHKDIIDCIEGTIDEAIAYLFKLKAEGCTHLETEYGYDSSRIIEAKKERLETDYEYEFRLRNTRELVEKTRVQELNELRRLKEKYHSE